MVKWLFTFCFSEIYLNFLFPDEGMAAEDEIISLMRLRGPVLPADVGKAIKTNIIFAGAHLSELASRQKVKISSLKVGGSPMYYLPGQEARLQEYIKNLDEKEVRAVEALRERKVLRDEGLEPLMRVALRNVKDFAVPLTVTAGGNQELFWKWYLLSDSEAADIIRKEIEPPIAEQKKEEVILAQPHINAVQPGVVFSRPAATVSQPQPITKPETVQKELVPEVTQKPKKPERKKREKKADEGIPLSQSMHTFFGTKGIKVKEEVLRKDTEIISIVEVPSAVGYLRYVCHARGKKRCTEKDLSAALIDGQVRKLPALFLYSGALAPKAEELARTDTFKTMVIHHLDHGS